MPASPYSSNVILAKARAMYGRCLTAQDFHNLLACHSVSEIASYLKNRTAYAGVLADINESTIHRGHLESLLRRKLWNDYASPPVMTGRWGCGCPTISSSWLKSSRSSPACG